MVFTLVLAKSSFSNRYQHNYNTVRVWIPNIQIQNPFEIRNILKISIGMVWFWNDRDYRPANMAHQPPTHPLSQGQIIFNPLHLPMPYNCALFRGSLLLYNEIHLPFRGFLNNIFWCKKISPLFLCHMKTFLIVFAVLKIVQQEIGLSGFLSQFSCWLEKANLFCKLTKR